MQCTRPITLKESGLEVPCGKCRACRISRSREWSVRMMHELGYHENSVFVTLTYDDEQMPKDESINKKELQRFFKRLRKRLDSETVIKYYASGEYGEKFGRPHYHAIIFGLSTANKREIHDCWKKGLVHVGTVTYDSARYVADYVQKDTRPEIYGGRQPPFSLMSQGIGKQFVLDNSERLTKDLNITMYGQNVGFPKYYRKLLDIPTEVMHEKSIEHHQEIQDFHFEKSQKKGVGSTRQSLIESRIQNEKNIDAKAHLKDKGRF